MKNIFGYLLLGLICFNSFAQNDAKAQEILEKVSTFYKAQKSIDTEFSLSIINEDADINETQKGQLLVKGEKYKLMTDELIRVSDGYSIWTHFVNDQEIQITEFDPEEDELTPAKIFTIYEDGFKYQYNGLTDVEGNQLEEIALFPTDQDNPYDKIILSINPKTNLIVKANVFSRNGSLIVYKIFNCSFSNPIEDNIFTYNTTKLEDDVDIIDLR